MFPGACPASKLSFRWGNSLAITAMKEKFPSVLIIVKRGWNQEIYAAARRLMALYHIFFSNWVTLYINLQRISIHFKSLFVLESLVFWPGCLSLTVMKSPTGNVVFPSDEDANGWRYEWEYVNKRAFLSLHCALLLCFLNSSTWYLCMLGSHCFTLCRYWKRHP